MGNEQNRSWHGSYACEAVCAENHAWSPLCTLLQIMPRRQGVPQSVIETFVVYTYEEPNQEKGGADKAVAAKPQREALQVRFRRLLGGLGGS